MTHGPIADLLPHTGDMILLDSVLEAETDRIVCGLVVRPDGPFNDADGSLPAWCGVELMAQAVAAWSGWTGKQEQRAVRLGFLLGTRHYRCNVDAFAPGSELAVEAFRNASTASTNSGKPFDTLGFPTNKIRGCLPSACCGRGENSSTFTPL